MQGPLAIEWLKIKNYRTFWVLIIMFAALFLIWSIVTNTGLLEVGDGGVKVLSAATSFGQVWVNMTHAASYLVLVPSIFIIISVTNEVQFRTNRQNVIDGWNRLQFYHAKWKLVITMAVATTLLVVLTGLILGLILGVPFSGIGERSMRIVYMLLLSLNYYGFSMLLGFLLKRSGLTIGLLFLVSIVEIMIYLYFISELKMRELSVLLPLQSADELLPSAATEMLISMGKGIGQASPWIFVAGTCAWTIIYYFLGRRQLLRSDW